MRLEDDEYRAQVLQAQGKSRNLEGQARAKPSTGRGPEEIAKAKADLDQAAPTRRTHASRSNARANWCDEGVLSKQALDDAQARYDGAVAKIASFDRAYELVETRPAPGRDRRAARPGRTGARALSTTPQMQLDNTVIRAPITGTILERNVEKGEFVTTGFVGDKGAKGYVVSIADLNDLKVELDINQNDFAKLGSAQPGIVTTDALSGSQIRRRHPRNFARGQPPEGHRAGESEGSSIPTNICGPK